MTMQAQVTATPDAIRDSWDRIANAFDDHTTPLTMALGQEALRRVGVRAGTRFLDVGAGSGALALPAARLHAEVLATDVAPAMIERLRTRAQREDLANLEACVMDGTALDLRDDAFDLVGSQNGVSLIPDLPRALAEMVRVTRSGGRAFVVTFGDARQAEFIGFFVAAIRAVVPGFPGLPTDPPPPPFRLADPDRLRGALTTAGLRDVRVEPIRWDIEVRSAEHLRDVVTSSNPIGAGLFASLDGNQRAEVLEVLEGMLRERADGADTALLTTQMNLGVGTKP